MTSTLSSVTLSEDIIFGGTAGADLLAGVRSTIMRIYTWLFMVGSGTVGGGEVAQKYRNFSSPRLLNLQLWARPKRKQRAPNLVRCPSTSTTYILLLDHHIILGHLNLLYIGIAHSSLRQSSQNGHLPSYRFGARQHCLYQVGTSSFANHRHNASILPSTDDSITIHFDLSDTGASVTPS